MAYVSTTRSGTLSLGERFSTLIETLRVMRARAALRRQTYEELSALTNRELADIGLSRGDIADIADEAARALR